MADGRPEMRSEATRFVQMHPRVAEPGLAGAFVQYRELSGNMPALAMESSACQWFHVKSRHVQSRCADRSLQGMIQSISRLCRKSAVERLPAWLLVTICKEPARNLHSELSAASSCQILVASFFFLCRRGTDPSVAKGNTAHDNQDHNHVAQFRQDQPARGPVSQFLSQTCMVPVPRRPKLGFAARVLPWELEASHSLP